VKHKPKTELNVQSAKMDTDLSPPMDHANNAIPMPHFVIPPLMVHRSSFPALTTLSWPQKPPISQLLVLPELDHTVLIKLLQEYALNVIPLPELIYQLELVNYAALYPLDAQNALMVMPPMLPPVLLVLMDTIWDLLVALLVIPHVLLALILLANAKMVSSTPPQLQLNVPHVMLEMPNTDALVNTLVLVVLLDQENILMVFASLVTQHINA
jgi:hypothetical protein